MVSALLISKSIIFLFLIRRIGAHLVDVSLVLLFGLPGILARACSSSGCV